MVRIKSRKALAQIVGFLPNWYLFRKITLEQSVELPCNQSLSGLEGVTRHRELIQILFSLLCFISIENDLVLLQILFLGTYIPYFLPAYVDVSYLLTMKWRI